MELSSPIAATLRRSVVAHARLARSGVTRTRRRDVVQAGGLDPHVLHALRDRRGLLRPRPRRARRRPATAPVADGVAPGAKVVIELAEGAAAGVRPGDHLVARYDRGVSTQPLRQLLESAFPGRDRARRDRPDRRRRPFPGRRHVPVTHRPLAGRAAPACVRGALRAACRRHYPRAAHQDEGSDMSYSGQDQRGDRRLGRRDLHEGHTARS